MVDATSSDLLSNLLTMCITVSKH